MKPVELVVLGGCHVAGYPIGASQAFPAQLSELLGGQVVGEVSYLTFTHLPEHLPLVDQRQPSHVVLQLGNHEFADSFRPLLRQLSHVFLARPLAAARPDKPAKTSKNNPTATAAAAGQASQPRHWARVAGLSLLTTLLWWVSGRHRRSFAALNACMARHPATSFVFLSPFPACNPTHNCIRHVGGWLLRQRLARRPNCHWVNSHSLLRPDKPHFVDASHLNRHAHRVLAYGLAAAVLGNLDALL
jgi:hypothetical protein